MPQSGACLAGSLLCVRVCESVLWRLLALILLVVPSEADLHLAQIAVHPSHHNFANKPPVAVDLFARDLGEMPERAVGQRLLRSSPEWLTGLVD